MREKIFITGGNGFIGKYTVELLKDNFDIYLFTENIFYTDFDKLFEELKPDYLINLAWVTGYGYLNSIDNLKFVQKGIEMYNAFYKYGGRKAFYAGTEQEYERIDRAITEDDAIDPISLYAECKADLGKILMKFSKEAGNSFVWGRFFFIYGSGEKEKRLMPSIINALKNDEDVTCSYEGYVRDYIHVEDVASAIKTCLFSDYTGFVNVGGGKASTIGEIASVIKSNIGGSGSVIFKKHEECNQPMHIQADNSLLKSLGWSPKYSLESGLKKEIDYLKNL